MFTKIKLKKSEKRIIKIAVFVTVVICLLQFVVLPIAGSYEKLKIKKKVSVEKLAKIIKKINESKNADKQMKIVSGKLNKYKNKVFSSSTLELGQVDLEEKVASFAKNNELEIKRRYQQKAKDIGRGYSLLATRFTVNGKLEDIVGFMRNIENDPLLIFITGLTFRSYRGYEANFEIRGIIKRGEK